MCTVDKKLEEMQRILQSKKMQPIFFIGSGLSRRYLESPNWEELLIQVAKKTNCDYEKIRDSCNGENEKIAQELEFYSFRNAEDAVIEDKNHRKILRDIIAEIFINYVNQYKKRNILDENKQVSKEICRQLNESLDFDKDSHENMVQYYSEEYKYISDKVEKCSNNLQKNIEIIELSKISPKAVITTNYDTLLEDIVFKDRCNVHIGQEGFTNTLSFSDKIDLYKIHGCVSKPESIIISKEDYDNFFYKSKYLYSKILTMFCEHPIVFIGYSLSDRNIKDILTVMIDIMTDKQKEEILSRMWIIDCVKYETEEKVIEKRIELLNGKNISVTCLYLKYYDKLYKAINDIVLMPQFENLKFTVSDQVIDLLIDPLYEQQDKLKVVTRELLQNALDACKKKNVDAKIEISVKEENDNKYLIIKDNGIGMNLQEVKENFLTVGKTNKKHNCDGLVGKYGVGILSIFLIGESAQVYTKKHGYTELSLNIYIKGDKKQVDWLNKHGNIEGDSFTVIKICLKNEIIEKKGMFSDNIEHCMEELGLESYITKPENTILVECKSGKKEIPKLNKREWFMDLNESIKLYKLRWLDTDEMEDDEKHLKKLFDRDGYIFYNDMISSVTYEKSIYRQLNNQKIPFVIIDVKKLDSVENEIKTNLSRSNIQISGHVMKLIARGIYGLEVNKFIELLCNVKGQIENEELKIDDVLQQIHNNCKIIGQNTDILLHKNMLFFSKLFMLEHIEIYGNLTTYEQISRESQIPILPQRCITNKTHISDKLSDNGIICISTRYLDDYVYNASSPQSGLKKEALVRVLDYLGIGGMTATDLSASIWQYVNENKQKIKETYESKSHNGILWFREDCCNKDIIEAKGAYLLIFKSSFLNKFLDDDFYEILNDNITKNSLNNIVGIK